MLRFFNRRFSHFCVNSHMKGVTEYSLETPRVVSGFHDKIITKYLQRILPVEHYKTIVDDCSQFANKLENQWFHLHRECELYQPSFSRQNGWGERIDEIITCDAWKTMKQISCKEGLVALPYENGAHPYSRIHQCIKLMLFAPLSGLYSCPLAMTDGAAFVIKKLGSPPILKDAFQHLTCRDLHNFWTSGQWMTEKKGGSDVAGSTETVAVWDKEASCHRLHGCKWFCSATDADMAFTLARSLDTYNIPIPGSKGLSLYYIETKLKEIHSKSKWNNLTIISLKDKLGTKQLPTAELLLDGSRAIKMSEDGRGVSSISGMLTITRIHNAIAAVSAMRRITMLAVDYSRKRFAFGSKLIKKSLHASTIAMMDIESRAAFLFLMDVVQLLGLQENNLVTEEDSVMLRILSPLLKLYTAKQAMHVVSEGLECFGGQGFIESTGLPGMLRDAQVLPIWEGTTNVLSLDTLRSLNMGSKDSVSPSGNFHMFVSHCKRKLDKIHEAKFIKFNDKLCEALEIVDKFITSNSAEPETLQLNARHISYSMSKIYMGVLLLESASVPGSHFSEEVSLEFWMKKDLTFNLCRSSSEDKQIDWEAFFD